jgi:hypothetical protein
MEIIITQGEDDEKLILLSIIEVDRPFIQIGTSMGDDTFNFASCPLEEFEAAFKFLKNRNG